MDEAHGNEEDNITYEDAGAACEPDESTPLLGSSPIMSNAPRYTLAVLGCVGLAIEYCQRVGLSVAIVAMTKPISENTTNFCPNELPNGTAQQSRNGGDYDWNKETQGLVLGAFYWGYATTNLIGGRVSEYLGGKAVVALGICASSFLTLITPVCAEAAVQVLIFCRVLVGVAQGVTFPAFNTLLATWFLPVERSKFSTIVFSGYQLGTVLGMTISGGLSASSFLGGWPSVFYLFGLAGAAWTLTWCFIVYNRPEEHPRMSTETLRYLHEHQETMKQAKLVAIPWKSLALSLPFWGLLVCGLGNDFGFYTLLNELPTYLNDVQHFNLNDNGLLSALPYLLMWLFSLSWAALMHWLTRKGALSLVAVRRLSMAAAMYGPMIGLLVMVFVKCNRAVAVCMMCLAGMLNGSINSGYLCSHQDLAPNLAGTLLGLTNTAGALAGIASPAITGAIVDEIRTVWAWQIVFIVSIVLYFVSCTFYLAVISAEVQPWNEPPGFVRVRLRRHSGRQPPDALPHSHQGGQ